jgi:hypothetical protein
MFSSRSKLVPARIAAAIAPLLTACALLGEIPAVATAAPEGGEEPPLPQLAFEPSEYDFGLIQLDGGANQTTMQLRNVGTVATQILSFSVSGGNGGFWTGPTDCIRTLNPGDVCSIQVYFGPYDAALFAAQLHANPEAGAGAGAELRGEGGRALLEAATNPTNFGSTPVGSSGVTRTIDVTNVGNIAAGAFIAVISGGAVGSFHLLDENCTGILLGPGSTCNLQVSFLPLTTGAKTARLSLFGEQDGGTQIVLSGIGLEPEPAVDEAPSPADPATSGPRQPRRAHPRPQRARGLHRLRRDLANRRAIG